MSRRLNYSKRLDQRDRDRIYQDSPTRLTPGYRPHTMHGFWAETRSGGRLRKYNGLRLLVVRDKFDLSKWVFYRQPAKNRSGIIVRSSNSFLSMEEAQKASLDFTQPVLQWDKTPPAVNLHSPRR